MFKRLLFWLSKPTYQNELDAYVASKNPTTVAEVEHWIRFYDTHVSKGLV